MMQPVAVEDLARRTIGGVLKGAKIEDSIVELKGVLPEPPKAARQIAALCNAVPGDDAIWVVGVDENGSYYTPTQELADWSSSVNKSFDGAFPDAKVYHIDFENHPIIVLHFTNTLRPFVTKRADNGDSEVPWRYLNKTRTARRSELLGLFVPASTKPVPEILKGNVTFERRSLYINVGMDFYLTPTNAVRLAMPMHQCELRLEYSDKVLVYPTAAINWTESMAQPPNRSLQFVFDKPTFFRLEARHYFSEASGAVFPKQIALVLQLGFAASEAGIVIVIKLPQTNLTDEVQHFEARDRRWTL